MTISEPTDRTGVIGIMALAVSVRRSAQGCPQGGAVVEPLDDTVDHVRRDVESGLATGEVLGTPTLFIDGVVHRGPYDAASLLQEVTVS
jgi:hypothetical protein